MRFKEYLAENADEFEDFEEDENSPIHYFLSNLHHDSESDEHEPMNEAVNVLAQRGVKPLKKVGPSLPDLLPELQHSNYSADVHRVLSTLTPGHAHNNPNSATAFSDKGPSPKNDENVLKVLRAGGVVASVIHGDKPVKGYKDFHTGEVFPAVPGDADDNVNNRHEQAGVPHVNGKGKGPNSGVVSLLHLKGVHKEDVRERAKAFVRIPNEDGHVVINDPHANYPADPPKMPVDWSTMPASKEVRDKADAVDARLHPGKKMIGHMRDTVAETWDKISKEGPKERASKLKEARAAKKAYYAEIGAPNSGKLLGANTKTKKSATERVNTIGLALAPHTLSGINQCLYSKTRCENPCLGTESGNNKLTPDHTRRAQIAKTRFLHTHPEHAARLIHHELTKHIENTKNTFVDTTKEAAEEAAPKVKREKGAPKVKKTGGVFKKKFDSPEAREEYLKANPHIQGFKPAFRWDITSDHGIDTIYKRG